MTKRPNKNGHGDLPVILILDRMREHDQFAVGTLLKPRKKQDLTGMWDGCEAKTLLSATQHTSRKLKSREQTKIDYVSRAGRKVW